VRLPPIVAIAVVAAAPLLAACGGGSDGACGGITREAIDPGFLQHVLGDEGVAYSTDPPTSGPHQPAPAVDPVRDEPLSKPLQVGILEGGGVLLQHRPDLPADQLAELEALAGDDVVVAPNPDLDDPVVATAWLFKRSCGEVDAEALREFVDERRGKGPDAEEQQP
jgi:hypothetical protein